MSTPADHAVDVFNRGFNCAQSVFSTFAIQFGIDTETALKLTSPLGAGMALRGEICGAVSGALLVLGLARGSDTPAGKDEIYRLAQELMSRFEQQNGSLLCRDLIELDVNSPEGWLKAKQTGKFTTVCPVIVRNAVEIVQAMLNHNG